jgi:large subunit ribosomal protein L25
MAVIEMPAEKRAGLGKGGARKARAAGTIPGILYGHGEAPVPLAIGARTFQLAVQKHKGGNAIVNLAIDGGQYTALIRDVQYDPITHHILHLDFQHISLTEMVEVEVSVHLIGVPSGVKDGGGILEYITRSVEVRCLPTQIPPSIDVDVTALEIGDSVHVRDLKVENAEILSDMDSTIATVVAPTVIEEKTAEEGATSVPEPELAVAKGKKDEDEEGKDKDKDKDKKEKKDKK